MKGWGQRPKEVLLGILSAFKKTCWRILKSSSKGTTEEPKWWIMIHQNYRVKGVWWPRKTLPTVEFVRFFFHFGTHWDLRLNYEERKKRISRGLWIGKGSAIPKRSSNWTQSHRKTLCGAHVKSYTKSFPEGHAKETFHHAGEITTFSYTKTTSPKLQRVRLLFGSYPPGQF